MCFIKFVSNKTFSFFMSKNYEPHNVKLFGPCIWRTLSNLFYSQHCNHLLVWVTIFTIISNVVSSLLHEIKGLNVVGPLHPSYSTINHKLANLKHKCSRKEHLNLPILLHSCELSTCTFKYTFIC